MYKLYEIQLIQNSIFIALQKNLVLKMCGITHSLTIIYNMMTYFLSHSPLGNIKKVIAMMRQFELPTFLITLSVAAQSTTENVV